MWLQKHNGWKTAGSIVECFLSQFSTWSPTCKQMQCFLPCFAKILMCLVKKQCHTLSWLQTWSKIESSWPRLRCKRRCVFVWDKIINIDCVCRVRYLELWKLLSSQTCRLPEDSLWKPHKLTGFGESERVQTDHKIRRCLHAACRLVLQGPMEHLLLSCWQVEACSTVRCPNYHKCQAMACEGVVAQPA